MAVTGPHIFLIGPGGVGKSSIGVHLAALLERSFIDIDRLFIDSCGDVSAYIKTCGYIAYAERNARIFADALEQQIEPAVFALSSGQLATGQTIGCITASRTLVRQHGVTVLPLPDEDLDASMQIVVTRQLERGFGLTAEREREKFRARIADYMALADIVIHTQQPPALIAADLAARFSSEMSAAAESRS